MQDRVSLRRFVNKWLPAGNHQRALGIQPRSLCAVIAHVHHYATRQSLLHVEIPDLHVAQAVVWVNREVVGYRSSTSRKTICECEWARADEVVDVRGIRSRLCERRLKREVLDHRAVLRQVVVDSVACPHHGWL